MPHLSLLTPVEVRIIETEGYKELIEKNKSLEEKIANLEATRSKIGEIDGQFSKILEDPDVKKLLVKKIKLLIKEGESNAE